MHSGKTGPPKLHQSTETKISEWLSYACNFFSNYMNTQFMEMWSKRSPPWASKTFYQGNGTRTKGKQMLMSCPKPQNIFTAKIALKLTGPGTWYQLNIFQRFGSQGTSFKQQNTRYTWLGAFLLVAINVDNMTLTISAIGEMELGHSPENTIQNEWHT